MGRTQVKGTNIGDKSVLYNDLDLSSAPARNPATILSTDSMYIHTAAAPSDIVKIPLSALSTLYQPVGSYLTGTKVDSFNTRTGPVTLTKADVEGVLTGAITSHTHPAPYITGGVLGANGLIALSNHPEGGAMLTPSFENDLAFIVNRGGSVSFYETTDSVYTAQILTNSGTSSFSNTIPFNGTPNYTYNSITDTTKIIVCDISMPFSLTYGNTFYVDFGATTWMAKDVSFYAFQSTNNAETVYKLLGSAIVNNTVALKYTYGSYSHALATGGTGYGYNRLRVVMTNWAGLSPRIAAIGAKYYNSSSLAETLLGKGGGTLYGTLTLNTLTASQILELDGSKNVISVAKLTAYNKNYGTTATDVKMNGTQSVGSVDSIARIDHVHPVDISRQPQLNGTGFVKASGTTITYDNTSYLPLSGKAADSELLDGINGARYIRKDIELNASMSEISSLDMNTINGTQLYYSTGLNLPGGINSHTIQLGVSNDYQAQISIEAVNGDKYHRIKDNGVWQSWRKSLDTVNFIAGTHYQAPITNPITGTGTANYLPKFTSGGVIGNSSVYESGGNVGIGTTLPQSKLHVISAIEGESLIFQNDNTNINSNNKFGFIIKEGAGEVFKIRYHRDGTGISSILSAGTLVIGSNNTEAVRILNNGNVLIGTTTDAGYKLDVNGTGRFSGALTGTSATFSSTVTATGIISYGALEQVKIKCNGNANKELLVGYNEVGNYGSIQAIEQNIAYRPLVLQRDGGNVLIGTTTDAGYKLDVNGTGRFSDALTGTSATFSNTVTATSFNGVVLSTGAGASNFLAGDGTYKAVSGGSSTFAGLTDVNLTSLENNQYTRYNSATSKWVNETPITLGVTETEINYLSGVTSNIQTQLNSKLTYSAPQNYSYTSTYNITNANTWYPNDDVVMGVTLGVGTWLVVAHMTIYRASNNALYYANMRLTDGNRTANYASGSYFTPAVSNNVNTITLTALITLGSVGVVQMQASSSQTGCSIIGTIVNTPTAGATATQIQAIKVG